MIRASTIFVLITAAASLVSCGGTSSQDQSAAQSAPRYLASSAYVAADYTSTVQQLYMAYFGRPADTGGLQNWSVALATLGIPPGIESVNANYATNQPVRLLVDSFASSEESATLYPTDSGTVPFVNSIYQNVLGRDADLAGLLFWSNVIDNGGLSKPKAAMSILAGALSNTSTQGLVDAALVQNRAAMASAITNALIAKGKSAGYIGNAAAAFGRAILASVSATMDASTISSLANCYVDSLSVNTLVTNIVAGTSPTLGCQASSIIVPLNTAI